ncbi:MAG: hypothetical protein QXM86_01650 [Candidatus Bathyarchaeia archaeon]
MVKSKDELKAKEITGKKVLILGEVGSGKTMLAARLIQELSAFVNSEEITVIDLAPPRKGMVGGKIADYVNLTGKIRYLSPAVVYTPRLSGRSREEVLHYANLNKKYMEPLFKEFIKKPSRVLVVNDITLYFHLGDLDVVLECVRLAETFLATAYYGVKLAEDYGAGISPREKLLTEKLRQYMDLVIQV